MSGFVKFLWPLALPMLVSFFAAVLSHGPFVETKTEEEDRHSGDIDRFSEKSASGNALRAGFGATLNMTMPAAFTAHTLWGIGSLAVLGSAEAVPYILFYVILLIWSFCVMVMAMKRFPNMSLIQISSGVGFVLARSLLFWGAPGI